MNLNGLRVSLSAEAKLRLSGMGLAGPGSLKPEPRPGPPESDGHHWRRAPAHRAVTVTFPMLNLKT